MSYASDLMTDYDDYALELDIHSDSFLASDYWEDTLIGLEGKEKGLPSPRLINFQDYTLNSPLISDELEAFMDFMKTGAIYNRYPMNLWRLRKKWLLQMNVDINVLKPIDSFHTMFANLMQSTPKTSQIFQEILNKTDSAAKDTFCIPQTYIKGWLKKDITFRSRLDNGDQILKYGSYMTDLIIAIWILNASTVEELKELQKKFRLVLKRIKDEDNVDQWDREKIPGIIWDSETLGRLYIGFGSIYMASQKMIIDRNMALMMKDTMTARFHTLFAIEHRAYDKYSYNHGDTVSSLYMYGDRMLAYDMKSAYEAFAMIEPISSYLLSEIARQKRPRIPQFTRFLNHIETKVHELKIKNRYADDFFDFLMSITDKRILMTTYGSFRHWGHPFIQYLEGLKALYDNVQMETKIDKNYAEVLASDLALKVLKKIFLEKHTWAVDGYQLPDNHILKEHVMNNTWPITSVVMAYKDGWHNLPLKKCWDIPEVVDPAVIYSDKTHSITRSELISHIINNPGEAIPTKKVLDTFISSPATDWPTFLNRINNDGLDREHLIIGLKAKEREVKWKGRFFALMSWQLREYFVFTEYLIKKEVLPLFSGLTMADDQTTLTKKMLDNTSGQGRSDYQQVTIANHIDYNKWNNFQRKEATSPVFKVLGQFFGMENLFSRTHEFFEQSLIYYRDRPDLFSVHGSDSLCPTDPDKLVCWEGQKGGLEGLRQKGWSVLNLLVIERESKVRNTNVKILAQGDNQVICTSYSIHPAATNEELKIHLSDMIKNNEVIMARIRDKTFSIGLSINEDETLQSADMLIYGKNIVYRGNMTCLEEKRYSRITCTTNDQLPSLGNILSTVSTNCLTVAHYSKSPLNAIDSYNWLGNFACTILTLHNPALRSSPADAIGHIYHKANKRLFRILVLYLDPSLGGISGIALTRFHIRMFPDPITESLSFWKIVHDTSEDPDVKKIARQVGTPHLLSYTAEHFNKLLEDPTSLNLPRGMSSLNLIKEEIRKLMILHREDIKNEIVHQSLNYIHSYEEAFTEYLATISPCFPRFLSEFKSATFHGLTESIIGLFENSKTIRNLMHSKMKDTIDSAIVKCEMVGIKNLCQIITREDPPVWLCSSSHADKLRAASWGRRILGTTVPHPAEMLGIITSGGANCLNCKVDALPTPAVIVIAPKGLKDVEEERGPYSPYFGSTTKENTSLIQPWEKETDISFIRKAANLRRAFGWFIDPLSMLGLTISDNLRSLTGIEAGQMMEGYSRTGSALHRFSCSRVSAGGYMANSPVYGSRMHISTDLVQAWGDKNYDFMFQALMLYAQQTAGELLADTNEGITFHFHLSCRECLREIEEVTLESPDAFSFPPVHDYLNKWKPQGVEWFKTRITIPIPDGDWQALSNASQSEAVGKSIGLIYSGFCKHGIEQGLLDNLFPIAIKDKVSGRKFLQGLMIGMMSGSLLRVIHRRLFYKISDVAALVQSDYWDLIEDLVNHKPFLAFCIDNDIEVAINNESHRIPPSYPSTPRDLGVIIKSYLDRFSYSTWASLWNSDTITWIFADFRSVAVSGTMIIAHKMSTIMATSTPKEISRTREQMKELGDLLSSVLSDDADPAILNYVSKLKIVGWKSELRHAVKKGMTKEEELPKERLYFTNQHHGEVVSVIVKYIHTPKPPPSILVPKISDPTISGLRTVQIATGGPTKIGPVLDWLHITPRGVICGGDGSGGISSLILRKYPQAQLIFNSLLSLENVPTGGILPSPPSAIAQMDGEVQRRCVNLRSVWDYPTDLSDPSTWRGFIALTHHHGIKIDLLVLDMELQDEESTKRIYKCVSKFSHQLFNKGIVVLIKTYIEHLVGKDSILSSLGKEFGEVQLMQTTWTGSHSSEIYVSLRHLDKSSHISAYVDWDIITPYLNKCYVFRSHKEEFDRATHMMTKDIMKGVPTRFLPDPMAELFSIWQALGAERVLMTRWREYSLNIMDHSAAWWGFASMCLIFQATLPIGVRLNTPFSIPSDQILEKLFAYYCGTWIFMSLITKSQKQHDFIFDLMNKPFDFSLGTLQFSPSKSRKGYQMIYWKLLQREPGLVTKKLYLNKHMGLIAAVIRYLIIVSKYSRIKNDMKFVLKFMREYKPALSEETIANYSGFLDPITTSLTFSK